jgi:hypothetical protein
MRTKIKTNVIATVCAATLVFASAAPAFASREHDPAVVAGDALVVRPLSFLATVAGAGVFVLALPVALTSGSIHSTADALVVQPGRFTFRRPLGDFDYWFDYHEQPQARKTPASKTRIARLKAPKEECK